MEFLNFIRILQRVSHVGKAFDTPDANRPTPFSRSTLCGLTWLSRTQIMRLSSEIPHPKFLDSLTVSQLVKKFQAVYETQRSNACSQRQPT